MNLQSLYVVMEAPFHFNMLTMITVTVKMVQMSNGMTVEHLEILQMTVRCGTMPLVGKYNDAFDHAQNLETLKGSILRLDVDGEDYCCKVAFIYELGSCLIKLYGIRSALPKFVEYK
jgi:hypothetical protein